MKTSIVGLAIVLSAIFRSGVAKAETGTGSIATGPLLLQNYAGDNVVVFYAGTPCYAGQLNSNLLSITDRNRLTAMVALAKASGMQMLFYYSQSGNQCNISSFGLSPN